MGRVRETFPFAEFRPSDAGIDCGRQVLQIAITAVQVKHIKTNDKQLHHT